MMFISLACILNSKPIPPPPAKKKVLRADSTYKTHKTYIFKYNFIFKVHIYYIYLLKKPHN